MDSTGNTVRSRNSHTRLRRVTIAAALTLPFAVGTLSAPASASSLAINSGTWRITDRTGTLGVTLRAGNVVLGRGARTPWTIVKNTSGSYQITPDDTVDVNYRCVQSDGTSPPARLAPCSSTNAGQHWQFIPVRTFGTGRNLVVRAVIRNVKTHQPLMDRGHVTLYLRLP